MMSEYNLLLLLFIMIHNVKGTKLSDWVYLGCFKDYIITRPRVLEKELYESDNNTRKTCIQDCFDKRYKFSGTEGGDECWCGNEMTSSEDVSDSECDHKCSGNEREYCGGNWRISIYNITRRYEVSSTTHDQTTEAITPAVTLIDDQTSEKSEREAGTKLSDWVYLGCFKDYIITRPRVLEKELFESDNNTREKCIQDCFDKRYKFSGTEGGDECWCGNEMTSSEDVSDSECDHKCSGNEREYCGGNWRISIYNITRRYEVSSTTHDQTTEAITSAVSVKQSTPTSVHTSSSTPSSELTSFSPRGSVIARSTTVIARSTTVNITDDQKSEKSELEAGDQKRSWTALYVSVPAVVIAVVVAVSVLALLKRRRSRNDQATQEEDDDTPHIYNVIADTYISLTSANARRSNVHTYMELKDDIKEILADQDNTQYITPIRTSLGEYSYIDNLTVDADQHI